MTSVLSPEQKSQAIIRMATNFEVFSPLALKILPKSGGKPVAFAMNEAQRFLHHKIEGQVKSTGRVRVITLKGRQQGVSTYTEGRYYWKLSHTRGKRAFILTHEQKATDNLFDMVFRYWQNAPAGYRPTLGASNAKELVFSKLDCKYMVATAGSKDTGRSQTAHYFHGSEIAFWPHAADHMKGIGQTMPDEPGTEMILESTANGTANFFHEMWQLASAGKSDYLPVFIPWFWQREYRSEAPADFEMDDDESDYCEAYGLDLDQMVWRRRKINTDFRGNVQDFDQEYPASAELAFASSSPRSLINALLVAKARRTRGIEAMGRKIMGVDPAEYGDDDTSVMLRQGRVAQKLGSWNGMGTMETVGRVGVIADRIKPDVIYVDATGVGSGVADRLLEQNYPVVRVHFGQGARDTDKYVTARDEMWGEMAEWLEDSPASIDDDNSLAAQLTSVQYSYDSKRRTRLESKEKMKERGLRSPDDADALALTFGRGGPSGQSTGFKNRQRFN